MCYEEWAVALGLETKGKVICHLLSLFHGESTKKNNHRKH